MTGVWCWLPAFRRSAIAAALLLSIVGALSISPRPAHATPPIALGSWPVNNPRGLTVTRSGEVLVVGYDGNNSNPTLRAYSRNGTVLRSSLGDNTLCNGGTVWGGPRRIHAGRDGQLYVLSSCGPGRIFRIDSLGTTLSTFATSGGPVSLDADFAVAADGHVFVPTQDPTHLLHEYDPAGNLVGTIDPASWTPPFSNFGFQALAVDESGLLWASDRYTLRKFTRTGTLLGTFNVTGGDPAFNDAVAVHLDDRGRVYVADRYANNSFIAEFDTAGNYLTQWSYLGTELGQLNSAFDVAADSSGELWVTDASGRIFHLGRNSTPQPTATFQGVANTALGSALLSTIGDGLLVISNIGTSGDDGVSFPAPGPELGRSIEFAGGLQLDPAVDLGAQVGIEMRGTIAGGAGSLQKIVVDVVSDGIDVTPDFSDLEATEVHVEAYLGENRVHSCRIPNGTAVHRGAPVAMGMPNSVQAAGDGISGVEVGLKKKPGDGCPVGVKHLTAAPTTIGGTTVVANRLLFSTLAPRHPRFSGTAVLTLRAPSALASSTFGAHTTMSGHLGQVLLSGQRAVADSSGVPSGGLHVGPAGSATLGAETNDDGSTVVGIGASGSDGVDVQLNATTGGTLVFGDRMGFSTDTDAGAALVHRVQGKVGCQPDSTVAVLTEEVFSDSIALRPDFSGLGATGVKITILDAGAVVHTGSYAPTQSVQLVAPLVGPGERPNAASINTSRSNLKDKASISSFGPRVSIGYRRPGPGAGPGVLGSAMPFDLKIGASRFQGDEVQFEAAGGIPVTEFTGSSLRQRNPGVPRLDSLRLGRSAVTVGAASAAHSAKGTAAMTAVNGKLVVHNIGSSGNDGVEVRAERPSAEVSMRLSRMSPAAALPASGAMRVASRGTRIGSATEEPILTTRFVKSGAKLRMGAQDPPLLAGSARALSPQATLYRLEVLLNGAVVASQDAANPQADFDRMPDQLQNLASGSAFVGTWDSPLPVSLVGGPTVNGNRVRLRPLGVPNDVEHVTAVDVTAADVLTFELGDWLTPLLGAEPRALGDAPSLRLGRNPLRGTDALDLSVTVGAPTWIELDVFDAQGRRVRRVFSGMQGPGTKAYRWAPSASVPSGLFFTRLKTATNEVTSKLVRVQ